MSLTIHERSPDLAAIIHDLRSPLTAIVAQAQMTRRCLDRGAEIRSASVDRALSWIQTLARQMTLTLEDVLTTASLSASESATVTDLTAVLSSAADQVEQALGQPRIRLDLPDRSVTGVVHGGRIGRAVVNVLENALKYSPEGGPGVTHFCRSSGRGMLAGRREATGE